MFTYARKAAPWQSRRPVMQALALVVLGAASLALALWAESGVEAHPAASSWGAEKAAGEQPTAFRPAARAESPTAKVRFERECRHAVTQKHYAQALRACAGFLSDPALAGPAHALMAAIYTTPTQRDIKASVAHAQKASALGDARGKFMLAAQMLAGHVDAAGPDRHQGLLQEARAEGVLAAGLYLQALDEAQACRQAATVTPLGLPVFCMFRAELLAELDAMGMRLRRADDERWLDDFAPGERLVTADGVELQYDVDSREEIHRLARLSYRFSTEGDAGRWAELLDGLRSKYGDPGTHRLRQEARWVLADGLTLTLMRVADHQLEVRYEDARRLQGRLAHLQERERIRRQDLRMAEIQAF